VKLCSFASDDPTLCPARLGMLDTAGEVVDVNAATAARLVGRGLGADGARRVADAIAPTDVVAFAEAGEVAREAALEAVDWVEREGPTAPDGRRLAHPVDTLRFLPAVPRPPLLRDFLAFEDHLRNVYPRLGRPIPPEWYEMPVYYKANPASVGAHGSVVTIPDYASELDFELELAALIVPGGIDIRPEDARVHLYGYTIYNDFSARAIQSQEMAVGLGPAKGKDFLGAHVLGPWLVTADEIADPYRLTMQARVNGERWAVGSSADMHWRFEDMLAHASRNEPVQTGEVFGSGTVGGGSGAELGRALHDGDVVELQIEGIGVLRNQVAAPATQPVGRRRAKGGAG